jgi:hypothetical protein
MHAWRAGAGEVVWLSSWAISRRGYREDACQCMRAVAGEVVWLSSWVISRRGYREEASFNRNTGLTEIA